MNMPQISDPLLLVRAREKLIIASLLTVILLLEVILFAYIHRVSRVYRRVDGRDMITLQPVFAAADRVSGDVFLVNERDLGLSAFTPASYFGGPDRLLLYRKLMEIPDNLTTIDDYRRQRPDLSVKITLSQHTVSEITRERVSLDLLEIERSVLAGRDKIRIAADHELRFFTLPDGRRALMVAVAHCGRGKEWTNAIVYTLDGSVPVILAKIYRAIETPFIENIDKDGRLQITSWNVDGSWSAYVWNGEAFAPKQVTSFMVAVRHVIDFSTPWIFFVFPIFMFAQAGYRLQKNRANLVHGEERAKIALILITIFGAIAIAGYGLLSFSSNSDIFFIPIFALILFHGLDLIRFAIEDRSERARKLSFAPARKSTLSVFILMYMLTMLSPIFTGLMNDMGCLDLSVLMLTGFLIALSSFHAVFDIVVRKPRTGLKNEYIIKSEQTGVW